VLGYGRVFKFFENSSLRPENHTGGDLNDPSLHSLLHHLSIEQPPGWDENGSARSSGASCWRKGFRSAISFDNGIIVVPQFITGEERQMTITAAFSLSQETIGVLLDTPTDNEGDDHLVDGVKAYPNPLVTIEGLEFFQG